MSVDCAKWISDNKNSLRGVGTLEDVSISVWLRAAGVTPEHVEHFKNAKNSDCVEGLVSYSDLAPYAIGLIHNNLINNRSFCSGFERSWIKSGQAENTCILDGPILVHMRRPLANSERLRRTPGNGGSVARAHG